MKTIELVRELAKLTDIFEAMIDPTYNRDFTLFLKKNPEIAREFDLFKDELKAIVGMRRGMMDFLPAIRNMRANQPEDLIQFLNDENNADVKAYLEKKLAFLKNVAIRFGKGEAPSPILFSRETDLEPQAPHASMLMLEDSSMSPGDYEAYEYYLKKLTQEMNELDNVSWSISPSETGYGFVATFENRKVEIDLSGGFQASSKQLDEKSMNMMTRSALAHQQAQSEKGIETTFDLTCESRELAFKMAETFREQGICIGRILVENGEDLSKPFDITEEVNHGPDSSKRRARL